MPVKWKIIKGGNLLKKWVFKWRLKKQKKYRIKKGQRLTRELFDNII